MNELENDTGYMETIKRLKKENTELNKQLEYARSAWDLDQDTIKILQNRIRNLEQRLADIKTLNRDEVEKII